MQLGCGMLATGKAYFITEKESHHNNSDSECVKDIGKHTIQL